MTLQSEAMGKLVAVDPDIQGGEPCIAGTRVTVRAVQEFASAGCSIVQIADEYPTLTFEQIDAALAFRPAHREAQPETDGGGEVKTLRTLLDNLVIAQKLSREIREHATDEARSYLHNTRLPTPTPGGQTEGALRSICQRMADDFQTSAIHHPNHILVSRTDFEAMVEALRLAALASKGV